MIKGKVIKIPTRDELSVTVRVHDIGVIKSIIDILAEFSKDERIDESIRNEYADRIVGLVKKDR
ncbi:hypothetical protein FQB35_10470 [Crassaminicella thermophila]|uniref:Uncharacterized protein n=1 Tax=Crassaminicella thermophila TaxID=2599308 RepID=A0A5C0SEY6_CRATE|nr:hypothetical protein [Crassaminicella thermophila]QEK12720.1 hypothetical protein FQB35_10470 [Crassaminicella thermophila]